jgi:hypothetical protein
MSGNPRLGGVERGLVVVAELLAALIANERLGGLACGNRWPALLVVLGSSRRLSRLELLQRLVLGLLKPCQGLLH